MGAEMYSGMSALGEESPVVARGVALHKAVRALTMAIGGEAWLGFMGNEFGHPDWIDFPRRAAACPKCPPCCVASAPGVSSQAAEPSSLVLAAHGPLVASAGT